MLEIGFFFNALYIKIPLTQLGVLRTPLMQLNL